MKGTAKEFEQGEIEYTRMTEMEKERIQRDLGLLLGPTMDPNRHISVDLERETTINTIPLGGQFYLHYWQVFLNTSYHNTFEMKIIFQSFAEFRAVQLPFCHVGRGHFPRVQAKLV